MAYAVTLPLNEQAAKIIQDIWRNLAAAGLADGVPRYAPHVTLAVYDTLDPHAAAAVIKRIAANTAPLPVSLGALGVFPAEKSVLWAAPAPSAALLALHEDLHGAQPAECLAYYLPGAWVPHCTLAGELTPAALGAALAMLAPAWQTVSGCFERLELVRFPPVEVLLAAPFTG